MEPIQGSKPDMPVSQGCASLNPGLSHLYSFQEKKPNLLFMPIILDSSACEYIFLMVTVTLQGFDFWGNLVAMRIGVFDD